METINFTDTDHKGRTYDRFYANIAPFAGPGWYVWGRNPEYGDNLIRLCGRPDVAPRRHPHYNGPVRRGWHTKREAAAIATKLNNQT